MKNQFSFKILSAFICFILTQNTWAMLSNQPHGSDEYEELDKTTLLVLLTGDENIDEGIVNGLEKYWTRTPYKIIDQDTYIRLYEDEKYSFLLETSVSTYKDGALLSTKTTLNVYAPGDAPDLTNTLSIGSKLLYSPSPRYTKVEYIGKLYEMRIKSLHQTPDVVQEIRAGGLWINGGFTTREMLQEHYRSRATALTKDTLYIPQRYTEESFADLKSEYDFPLKLVSDDEIEELIDENKSGFLLDMTGYGVRTYAIFDLKTDDLVFFREAKKTNLNFGGEEFIDDDGAEYMNAYAYNKYDDYLFSITIKKTTLDGFTLPGLALEYQLKNNHFITTSYGSNNISMSYTKLFRRPITPHLNFFSPAVEVGVIGTFSDLKENSYDELPPQITPGVALHAGAGMRFSLAVLRRITWYYGMGYAMPMIGMSKINSSKEESQTFKTLPYAQFNIQINFDWYQKR